MTGATQTQHPMPAARTFPLRMTKAEAHDLLDAAREGVDVSRIGITRALIATGDMRGRCRACGATAGGRTEGAQA